MYQRRKWSFRSYKKGGHTCRTWSWLKLQGPKSLYSSAVMSQSSLFPWKYDTVRRVLLLVFVLGLVGLLLVVYLVISKSKNLCGNSRRGAQWNRENVVANRELWLPLWWRHPTLSRRCKSHEILERKHTKSGWSLWGSLDLVRWQCWSSRQLCRCSSATWISWEET